MNICKKWILVSISILIACLILVSSTVIVIDPFFLYHEPLKSLNYYYDDSLYQGAGIIKHFNYETLITGTSLIQNMKPSTVKKLTHGDAVKVPFCGRDITVVCDAVNLAIKYNKNLKNIILNIDTNLLTTQKKDDGFPSFLYDNNIFNDVNYFLNKDIAFEKCISVINNQKALGSMDTAFSSENTFYFAEFSAKTRKPDPFKDEKSFYDKIKNNLSVLENVISKNPNIKFYLFIPPRNILYLQLLAENNQLDSYINANKIIYETLSVYDNVNLSFFQNNVDIIGNLYNYCDYIHFSSYVSDIIVTDIFNGQKRLNDGNYISELESLKKIYNDFDYTVFSSECFPFKDEVNIKKYVDMVRDYIVIVNCSKNFVPNTEAATVLEQLGIKGSDYHDMNKVYLNGKEYSPEKFNCKIENNSIFIDKIDYSLQLENGINFVIYTPDSKRVIDSAYFDNNKIVHERNVRK